MPKFKQIAEILQLMKKKECIRNVGIIAHVDHGKTTLTDSLLAKAGLLPAQMVGAARALDYLEEEQRRGITIKTANISLPYEIKGKHYIVNLVDTPGHVDFTGKVTRALRTIDGAIVVVDAVEEVMAQTESVLRQALEERVKPVLFINKVDRLISDLKLSEDEIQTKLLRITRDVDDLIEIHAEPEFRKKWKVSSSTETVAFGSALHRWGFTIETAQKKGVKFSNIIENYHKKTCEKLSKLLPLCDAILCMIASGCPDPLEAQQYRVPKIWKGDLNSEVGKAMMNCDENAPTTLYITNVHASPEGDTIVTGRLFSGSVKEGDALYLVSANKQTIVKKVSVHMGAYVEDVARIPAGNLASLAGFTLAKTGETLVSTSHKDNMVPFESVKYISEPVIMVAIEPKNPSCLPWVTEAMKRLSLEDPNLAISINHRTGEHLISGIGELHLETALKLLRDYSGNIDVVVYKPAIEYRESITKRGQTVMAKSLNKQNEFWLRTEPIDDETLKSLKRNRKQSIWAFEEHDNILVGTTGLDSCESEVKSSIMQGFSWACKNGPLCEQPMKNVKATLEEVHISEDQNARDTTQIIRAVSRAIIGSFLTASPVLLEPIYKIELSTPTQWFGKCAKIINARRGKILSTKQVGTLQIVTGHIPVAETIGLTDEIRSATSGHAFWQSIFNHWGKMPEIIAAEAIPRIRQTKGLPREIPRPDKFIDEAVKNS